MKKLKFEDWLRDLLGNLAEHFDLGGWQITFDICHEEHNDERYACIFVDSKYLNAKLTYYPMAVEDFDKKNYERLLECSVHELVHIFLDPLNEHTQQFLSSQTEPYFTTMLEQQTQKITRVLTKTLPKNILPR